jgi:predicted ester cyclase
LTRRSGTYHGHDFCVVEHECTITVKGAFAGVEADGRQLSFRMLHIFEFTDGLISRENVWMDSASMMAQLTQGSMAATG